MSLFASFAQKWSHADYPPDTVQEAELNAAERSLGFVFPDKYREEVLISGLPRTTIALLHSIVEGDHDLRDVSDFYAPSLIVEQTRAWRDMGLPKDLVVFASDCQGNMFAFRAGDRNGAVWFFDHDFGDVEMEAGAFAEWLQRFIELPRISPDS